MLYLKSQINPHFLYNTLETIKGIAYARGVGEIREMTDALGRIFRYSIKGGDKVAVRDETEIVQAYIRIQKVRFGDRFTVREQYSAGCEHYRVIKMILQPLVENAVFHGIEPCLYPAELTVGCREERGGRELLLWVADNGVGMDPDRLEQIRLSLSRYGREPSSDSAPKQYIGLLNVHNRIRIAYGPEFGIAEVESAPGMGTRVSIRLPAEEDDHV
ncbi:sensor histidine kinase [Paenibacillus solisilvae]|uniref:Sensor histidine kinase n=1 Tax=Paenibacillus solisilvae TaxID=2486751 RepID=A0ABW0VRM6_9BACL